MAENGDREQLASAIERFVRGTAGPYEWDDVVCSRFEDPELEAIRQAAESVDVIYPPSRPNEYCSDEGASYLLTLVARLRRGA